MDSFEFNKFAGAILLTLLVTLGVSILAEEIYTAHTPEQPGYEVVVADDEAGTAEAEAEEVVPLGVLLAAADVQRGEAQARKCAACHKLDGTDGVGPHLNGVVGRNHAAVAGFAYSEAMAAKSAEPWTEEA
ncbi:MAG: c-type cytochrome, partial [Thermaurantiacus sp.]